MGKLLRSPVELIASLRAETPVAEISTIPGIQSNVAARDLLPTRSITVISANLCHDWPRYRRQLDRLQDFASLVEVENADLLLLQEVSRTRHLHIDSWLSDRLGMAYVYTRANGHPEIGFEEGLAVYSRYPLSRLLYRQLDDGKNPFVRRIALGARVNTPCGDLLAFSTHLGLFSRQNAAQLLRLQHWINNLSDGETVLIGGDFNAHENTRRVRQIDRSWVDTFRHHSPDLDGTTHTWRGPAGFRLRRRLDYIFLQPGNSHWEVVESRHLQTPGLPHSDHHAILSRISPAIDLPVVQLNSSSGNPRETHPDSGSSRSS